MDLFVLFGIATGAGLAAWLVRDRLPSLVTITSRSMLPALEPGALVPLLPVRRSRPPARGDVVVIQSAELGRRVVKRIIGLPGEVITVVAGVVRVNGSVLAEPWLVRSGGRSARLVAPAGSYVVLGDNRAESADSRSWRQPYVPRQALRGRVVRPSWGPWASRAGRP